MEEVREIVYRIMAEARPRPRPAANLFLAALWFSAGMAVMWLILAAANH